MKRIGGAACILAATLTIASAGPAGAAHFKNAYVSFDLPDKWTCGLEGTEWVCKPPTDASGKTAMIVILTAKEVGPTDSPLLYQQHLEDVAKTAGVETVQGPTTTVIGQSIWLDATFMNSELPNYRTRYLVRNEGDVGVLVTFSAHRSVVDSAAAISDAIAASVAVDSAFVRPELRNQAP